jgi:hypothetical protein
MHSASATLPSGLYLLATTVADPGECEPIRDTLRGLLVGRTPRLHWRDQTPRRRRFIAGVLADLAVTHTVVVGMPLDQARQERARRQCMERLFHELHALAVVRVWIEARTASLNNRDQTMIAALRSRHVLPDSLTFNFAHPVQEPMLWLPDAIAGAVGMHYRKDDDSPYQSIADRITEHSIRLD